METKYLKDIGLSDSEINVYMGLLKHGESLASDLAKNTGLNRTLTYTLLDRLIQKGLVSYVIKDNTKYFISTHPEKLIDFLKEKEANIQKLIPELLKVEHVDKKTHSVELYDGKEGLKTVLNEVIRSKAPEFIDMTSGMTTIVLPQFWMDQWNLRRSKAIKKTRFLYNDTAIGLKRAKEVSVFQRTEVRLLPKGLCSPSHIYVWGNNVGITLWEKEYPFAIAIHSKEVAARFKEFFEWFWRIGKPLK
jgi:sugar-specific transcriptional regulator TrmB